MAIKFFNIKTREVRTADTEPMVSALWSSSDRGPNRDQGQDMGWRLAPEVVVEMRKIMQDEEKITKIAAMSSMLPEDVKEKEVIWYISSITKTEDAPVGEDGDYSEEYDQEIRRLSGEKAPIAEPRDLTDEELEAEYKRRMETKAKKAAKATEK